MRFKTFSIFISLALLSYFYVNCSGQGAKFGSSGRPVSPTASVDSDGNGQGYGGKIKDGQFRRQYTDYKCEQKPLGLQGLLQVAAGNLFLTLDSCVDFSYEIGNSDSRVDFLPYNQDFIGFNHAFYERQDPAQPSALISEAWCRWTQSNRGVDAVVRINPSGPVTAQIYLGSSQDAFVWDSRLVAPTVVQRTTSASGYSYVNSAIHLQINSAMNANGKFQGHLRANVDGVDYDMNVDCRMMQMAPVLPVVTPSLIGLWQMNGPLGVVPANIIDLSGMNNNGVSVDSGSSMVYQAGILSESIRFVDNDDAISVPPSPSLNNLTELSVSAWVRGDPDPTVTNAVNGGSILWKGQSTPTGTDPTTLDLSSGWYFGIPAQSGRLEFKVAYSGSTMHSLTNPSVLRIFPGQWHHVAVTWNGAAAASGVRFYIDGQLATPDTPTVGGVGSRLSDVANSMKMGFYSDNLYNTFRGNLDQVQIWNRVLTAAEINDLFNSGTVLP
ncbi:MAG: LamG domain-containing protein [Bdellovibrionales bacterium]